MPYNEFQKQILVEQSGYDYNDFEYDEGSDTIKPRVKKISPGTSNDLASSLDTKLVNPSEQEPQNKDTLNPLQTAGFSFVENALPSMAGGLAAGKAMQMLGTRLVGSGFWGTLAGIGLIGGSAVAAGRATGAVQNEALNAIAPDAMDTLHRSQQENPLAATTGSLASILLGGMNPSPYNAYKAAKSAGQLAIGMSPKADEIANLSNVAAGAGIGTGIDALSAYGTGNGEQFNPLESLLINTIFNKPNAIGRRFGFTDPADIKSEPNRGDLLTDEQYVNQRKQDLSNFYKSIGAEIFFPEEGSVPFDATAPVAKKKRTRNKKTAKTEEVIPPNKEYTTEDLWKDVNAKKNEEELNYQNEETPRTQLEKDTAQRVIENNEPTNESSFWRSFFSELANRRGTSITEDGTIVDQNTGKPVLGQTDAEGNITVNPLASKPDTRPHELTHVFIPQMLKSPRNRDRVIANRYLNRIKETKDYKDWAANRRKENLNDSVEEYAATNTGINAYRRALDTPEEKPSIKEQEQRWWNDTFNYMKTRFTKHATLQEMQDTINYKLMHDPDFAFMFKRKDIIQNIPKSATNVTPISNDSEVKLVGSTMWKGKEVPESNITPEMDNAIIENYGDFFKRHPIGSEVKASQPDGGGSFYGIVKGHSRKGNLQIELQNGDIRYSSLNQVFGENIKDPVAISAIPKNQEASVLKDQKKNPFEEVYKAVDEAPDIEVNKEIPAKEYKPNYPTDDKMFKYQNESSIDQSTKRGPFYLESIKHLEDNYKSDKAVDSSQLISSLRNKYPGEWDLLEESGIRDAFPAGSKVSGKELANWINENGPRVEVKKLLADKPPFEETALANDAEFRKGEQRRNELQHEFETDPSYSVIPENWVEAFRYNPRFGDAHNTEIKRYLKTLNLSDEKINKVIEFKRLDSIAQEYYQRYKESDTDSATRRYQQVNPKPLDKMPGAVDLLVRIPVKDSAKYKSNHYPQSGDNLLAHVRGYEETLPDGKKVFHVFEVQSDWAQDYRESLKGLGKVEEVNGPGSNDWSWVDSNGTPRGRQYKSREEALKNLPDDIKKQSDPLLKDYNRLAIKAAIKHAKEIGADYVAISDAETAMMTEQHDKMANEIEPVSVDNIKKYYSKNDRTGGYGLLDEIPIFFGEDAKNGKYVKFKDGFYRVDKPELNDSTYNIQLAKELAPYAEGKENYISQEQGMRFNYDDKLQKIAQDLTGSEGESISFGEHQNKGADVFKNQDGSPKVDITAKMYPVNKTKDEFTLTRKKYSNSSILGKLAADVDKVRDVEHPKANLVADAFNKFYEQNRSYKGKFFSASVNKLISKHLDIFNPKELWVQDNKKMQDVVNYYYDMMDKGSSTIKPDATIQQIVEDLKKITLYAKIISKGMKSKLGDPNYLPHIPARDVLDYILNKPFSARAQQLIKDWFDYYTKDLGLSYKEAEKALKIFKAGYEKQNSDIASQYGPIDKAEGMGIPRSWREKKLVDILSRFSNRYARRLAFIDAIEKNSVVKDALENPSTGIGSADAVRKVMADIQGQRDIDETNREAISGIVRAGWLGTLTGAKDFVTNPFLGFQHQELGQAFISPFKAWSHFSKNLADSYEAGINRMNISAFEFNDSDVSANFFQGLRRFRDVINTATGRNFLEKATRATAFGQGKFVTLDNLYRARKGTLGSQGEKFLNDFFPDWRSHVKDDNISLKLINDAAARYVESVQGTYDPRGLPSVTMRGSWAPFLSLSRWSFEKMTNFEKYVVNPARKGNYRPLLMQTLGMFLGGTVVNKLVEEMTNKKERTPEYKEIMKAYEDKQDVFLPITYKLAALASLSGYAGMAGDVARMIMDKTFKNNVQGFSNPSVEGIMMIGENAADALSAGFKDGFDLELLSDFILQNIEDSFQVYRLLNAHLNPKKAADLEKSDKMRDIKLFSNMYDYDTGDTLTGRPNPFRDKDIKKFREEDDIRKAAPLAKELMDKAFEEFKEDKNLYKLKKALNKIRFNQFRTMPNPETAPDMFAKYFDYLVKTQGIDKAKDRRLEYLKKRMINRAKSEMITSL